MSLNVLLKLWTALKLYSLCPPPHIRLSLGPHSLGCFSMSISCSFFLEGCQSTGPQELLREMTDWNCPVICLADHLRYCIWKAWKSNQIFWLERLSSCIYDFRASLWSSWWASGEMVSAWHQEQVGGGQVGQRRAINGKPRQQVRASPWCLQFPGLWY